MYLELAYSPDAFARLIKFRITQAFLPTTQPLDYPVGSQSWLDGLVVHDVKLEKLIQAPVVLNEWSPTGRLEPVSSGYAYDSVTVAMDISLTIFYARVQDVASAGVNNPPTGNIPIPIGTFRVFLNCFMDMDTGIPQVQMLPDHSRFPSYLPPPVINLIAAGVTQQFAFDIAGALAGAIPDRIRRVRNCGLSLDGNDNLIFRFEFPSLREGTILKRQQDWQQFTHNPTPAKLGGADWCVDIEGAVMAAQAAMQLSPTVPNKKPLYFDPGVDWRFENGRPPKFVIKKWGRIENACAGNDVRFDFWVYSELSVVPNTNTIRGLISFELDKNNWDVAKCFGLLVVNPLFLAITAFDQGGPIPLSFALACPLQPLVLPLAAGLLIGGVDHSLAKDLINKQLGRQPTITPLPDNRYALDQTLAFNSPLTQNWPMLTDVVGEEGRLVMSGELRVPPPILPRLRARDLEGFSPWHLADRCEPGRGQEINASLQLSIEAGYRANQAIHQPLMPLQYANPRFEIVGDTMGIYSFTGSEYRHVFIPNIPGKLEAVLRSSTLERAQFQPFKQNPYSLRIRFFTNGGVREYAFARPGVYKDYKESIEQMTERINNCKRMMHEKWFSFRWLIDPPPDGKIGQRWEVHIRGLERGRKLNVWNANGEPLGVYSANEESRIDLSIMLGLDAFTTHLVLGLDDASFMSAADIRQRGGVTVSREEGFETALRQTPMFPLEDLSFEEPIDRFKIYPVPGGLQVVTSIGEGRESTHFLPTMHDIGDSFNTLEQKEMFALDFLEVEKRTNQKQTLYTAISPDVFLEVNQDKNKMRFYQGGIPRMGGEAAWDQGG